MRRFEWLLLLFLAGCEGPIDAREFQRRSEKLFVEINPGFGIVQRDGMKTAMVRGDQLYSLDSGPLFEEYQRGKRSASDYFGEWRQRLKHEAEARRKPLEKAEHEVIPILKAGAWIRVHDLGAIGPKRAQDSIRPWRKKLGEDLYVLLAVPEDLLGYRYVSVQEVTDSKTQEEKWLERAVDNLVAQVGSSTGAEHRDKEGRLLVFDLANKDGIAGLILSPRWRKQVLAKFDRPELSAALPNRDVLIIFDGTDFVTTKPIRARAHSLYDSRNHPGFRGLIRFDEAGISIMEAGREEKKAP